MGPFLVAEFASPQAMLSWSLTRPGFVTSRKVAWLEVRNADLPLDVDPIALLETKMAEVGHEDAVHLMTSRTVRKHHFAAASFGQANASCLATVGLGNADRVGESPAISMPAGTINRLAHVDRPLSTAALIEAMSIASEARTAAIMDLNWRQNGKPVTGTGTDCIVIAAPDGEKPEQFAGLHTDIGAAIGRAVYDVVRQGGELWIAEQAGSDDGMAVDMLAAETA
ncbi:adenosylcobinamide amidohydrolase [Pseudaminobacter soli (ex Li et al. 2025)]|nr:adenosylcobinamide amidohydrolase [Mesorhizobium soli]